MSDLLRRGREFANRAGQTIGEFAHTAGEMADKVAADLQDRAEDVRHGFLLGKLDEAAAAGDGQLVIKRNKEGWSIAIGIDGKVVTGPTFRDAADAALQPAAVAEPVSEADYESGKSKQEQDTKP